MIYREWHAPYSSGRLGRFVPLLRLNSSFPKAFQIDLKGNGLNPSLGLKIKPVLSAFSLQSTDPTVYQDNTLLSMLVTPNMEATLSLSFRWYLTHPYTDAVPRQMSLRASLWC